MTSPQSLLPVAAVLARLGPPRPLVRVDLAAAVGRVLAEDLVGRRPVPTAAVALLDGLAVAAADLVGASPYTPALLAAPPAAVRAGETLPPGCDAILPASAAIRRGSLVEVSLAVAPGENVLRPGEDIAAGSPIRRRGEVLRPLDAEAARRAGLADAAVADAALGLACPPAERGWIEGLLAGAARGARTVPAIDPAAALVLALGVPSPEVAEEGGLALSGAEGVGVGGAGGRLVLAGPARPAAVAALALAIVAPAFERLLDRAPRAPWRQGPLTRNLSSRIGLTEVALVRSAADGLEPLAAGSLPLVALLRAEGYLILQPESEGLPRGTPVEAFGLWEPG